MAANEYLSINGVEVAGEAFILQLRPHRIRNLHDDDPRMRGIVGQMQMGSSLYLTVSPEMFEMLPPNRLDLIYSPDGHDGERWHEQRFLVTSMEPAFDSYHRFEMRSEGAPVRDMFSESAYSDQ